MPDTAHEPQTPPTDSDQAVDRVPLVVDLDGTLCRTDTLHEGLLALVSKKPRLLARLPGWLREGRAGLKARIADQGVLDPAALPLNEIVLAEVAAARDAGRPTALVSAADQRQVTAVAEATGLFDEAHGTTDGRNLKGPAKAAFLAERFGRGSYDYIGDAKADLPIWAEARQALTVSASPALRRAAEAANPETRHLDPPTRRWLQMLRALRPHQWSKNALLFLPALAAHDLGALPAVLLGFVAFCLTASSVYVINDLVDLASDRAHPRKCRRPFASGALTAAEGAAMTGVLLATALALALLTTPAFVGVLSLYLVLTFAYSLDLKRRLIVDVLALAGLYTIRIVAGGVAAGVALSPWMLGLSVFLFLALAAVKRQAELQDQLVTGRASSGRAYRPEDLPILRGIAISAGQAAILVLALYIASDEVQALYPRPAALWLVCPLLLYWVLRMVMKTHRGEMTDDPIVFAAKDRASVLTVIAAATVVLVAAL